MWSLNMTILLGPSWRSGCYWNCWTCWTKSECWCQQKHQVPTKNPITPLMSLVLSWLGTTRTGRPLRKGWSKWFARTHRTSWASWSKWGNWSCCECLNFQSELDIKKKISIYIIMYIIKNMGERNYLIKGCKKNVKNNHLYFFPVFHPQKYK